MAVVRHGELLADLGLAIVETPGATEPGQRQAAAAGALTGTNADGYLANVREASYRIVDDDIDELKRAGMSEDAILELTLAAAFGEARRRFDGVVAALGMLSAEES
jgi:alkylhydroperoxidase family enzyme